MLNICKNVKDLMYYGGTGGVIMWQSGDSEAKYACTYNLQMGPDFIPRMIDTFTTITRRSLGNPRLLPIFPLMEDLIIGQGNSKTNTTDAQGWRNKTLAIKAIMDNIRGAGCRYSIFVYVTNASKTFLECNSSRKQDIKQYWQPLGAYIHGMLQSAAINETCWGLQLKTMESITPTRKRTRENTRSMWKPNQESEENQEAFRDAIGEGMGNPPGSVAWYSSKIRQDKYPSACAIFENKEVWKWALLDARMHGKKGMAVHHNMYATVSVAKADMSITCSCDVSFVCTGSDHCVHTGYVKQNLPELISMRFPGPGGVVPVNNNYGQTLAYYCKDGFVREKERNRFRCDAHKSYDCIHVHLVRDYLKEDGRAGSDEENSSEVDPCSEEEEERYILPPANTVDQHIDSQSTKVQIEFPFTGNILKGVRAIGVEGWHHAQNPEQGSLWFGDALKPRIPSTQCSCGHMYTEDCYKRVDMCTVYLIPEHGSKMMHCYKSVCPSGNPRCDIHYMGLEDGLLRIGQRQIISLELAVKAALSVGNAQSLSSQWEAITESYEYYGWPFSFVDINRFRRAAYLAGKMLLTVTKNIGPTVNSVQRGCTRCPLCQDRPDVVIVDATSMTIKSSAYAGTSMTKARKDLEVVKRCHDMPDRRFLDYKRKQIKYTAHVKHAVTLTKFAEWLEERSKPSTKEPPCFKDIEELLLASRPWDLQAFLTWAHERGSSLQPQTKLLSAIGQMIVELASPSPVTAYCNLNVATRLQEYERDGFPPVLLSDIDVDKFGPKLAGLLEAMEVTTGTSGEPVIELPRSWHGMLREMIERALFIHSGSFPMGLGPEVDVMQAETHDYLSSGMISLLPRCRDRPFYEADKEKKDRRVLKKDKPTCRHKSHRPGKRTGGVFNILCAHGFCYASFVIKDHESRNEPFTFFTCYMKEAPKVIVYDFACALMDYCLNRCPNYFKHTLFVVDRFHWGNHVACARSFNLYCYYLLRMEKARNSSACEQIHSAMKRLKFVLSKMGQEPFLVFLRLFVMRWNQKKYYKMTTKQNKAKEARIEEEDVQEENLPDQVADIHESPPPLRSNFYHAARDLII